MLFKFTFKTVNLENLIGKTGKSLNCFMGIYLIVGKTNNKAIGWHFKNEFSEWHVLEAA